MSQHDPNKMDPFGPWRSFRDASMDAWAKALTEAVGTDAFAQAMGTYLDSYLATSAPFQKAVDQYMNAVLPRMSLPTRDEVIDLARRMTNIELRLDDLDAKTDQIMQALGGSSTLSATASAGANPTIEPWLQAIDDKMTRILLMLEASGATGRATHGDSAAAAPEPSAPSAEEQAEDRAIEGFQDTIG